MIAMHADQTVTMVNPAGCRLLEGKEDEIVGQNWFDAFVPGRIREESRRDYSRIISGTRDDPEKIENLVLTKSGQERRMAWHISRITDENGNITGTLRSGEDITERIATEEKLRLRNEELMAS